MAKALAMMMVLTSLAATTQIIAISEARSPFRQIREARPAPSAKPSETLVYGKDSKQTVDYFAPAGAKRRNGRVPIVIYVHGGGWAKGDESMVGSKPEYFGEQGIAFASISYRLTPDATVEQQAQDVAAAIKTLRSNARRLGFDSGSIILMGHSAGAHLAALVGTDPSYAGPDFMSIKGVLLLDGAAYDVPKQIVASPFMAKRTYIPAFGTDPVRQKALSPFYHAGAPNVPQWLILYVTQRKDAEAQSLALGDALKKAGAQTTVEGVTATKKSPLGAHMEINRPFGTGEFLGKAAVERFMLAVFGP